MFAIARHDPVEGRPASRRQLWPHALTLLALTIAGPTPSEAGSAPGAGAPQDWLARVSREIRRSEYEFSLQSDGSLSAPNRAHDLRSSFTDAGLSLVPRSTQGGAPSWRLGLSVIGYGREGDLQAPDALLPTADRNRLEFRRHGVTEWYVNDERGIEQGFDLSEPADASVSNGPMIIEMSIQGDLLAFPSDDRRQVMFTTSSGAPVVRYGELRVTDALGAPVAADLDVIPGRLRIRIHDAGARYPLHVDPLMTSPSWTAESDQASAQFGFSVSTAGDVNGDGYSDVIVGANLYDNGQTDEGRAYVYLGSASGLASGAAWTAEGNQASAQLGWSVAAAGDVNGDGYGDVIVGAPTYTNGQASEGRAYLYLGSASGLAAGPAWTAESDQAGAFFGWSVATAGDVNGDGYADVIVGASLYDNGQTDEGRSYLYLGSASGLAASAAWTASGGQPSAQFGYSVATAGDVDGDGLGDVIVGAPGFSNGQSSEGMAFVFLGTAMGLASSPAWTAESNQADAQLGWRAATAGDVNGDGYADVIVAAPGYDNGQTDEGAAFLWYGGSQGLGSTGTPGNADWSAEINQIGASLSAVAAAGDVNGDGYSDVLVGAYGLDTRAGSEAGQALLWYGSAAGLGPNGTVANAPWRVDGLQGGARFGVAVATAGDVNGDGLGDVIIGADLHDNGQTDEGRAFVYLGSASGLATVSGWTAESNQAGAEMGTSATTAGDVNGDGYSDVIVGALDYDNGEANEGRTFLYLGSASGLSSSPAWTAEGNQTGALFGCSVASAGDVNGDGYSDVIVGAFDYDNGETDEGRAYLYLGSALGLSSGPAWTAESNQANARFGISVASAGDVNGDGYSDVIVGAALYSNVETNEGRAYLYLGSASGLATSPAWAVEGNQADAHLGESLGTAGDVNGDGYSDVIVGAWLYDNGQTDEGRAYVYLGSASGLSASPAWVAEGDQTSAAFGTSVGTAGDVNGDGYADVVVGAFAYSNGEAGEGRAYVYLGSGSGLATTPAWTAEVNQIDAWFGGSVATAGDVNGDGYSDVIVGAPLFDNAETDEGRAYLYLGSASGLATSPAWTAESNQADARFGSAVGTAGDVNGDGYSDVLVGAYLYDSVPDEGKVFLFYGNGAGVGAFGQVGLSRRPRQMRWGVATPIALLGRSDSETTFRLNAVGRTAAGRGRVKLEWEVKPLGTGLDGTGLARTKSFIMTSAPGASGSAAAIGGYVTGLAPSTVYHWRARSISDNPFFPHSPWLTLPYNGRNETDLRTPPASTPTVIAVDPPNGAEGVATSQNVVVAFSEPIDPNTLGAGSFLLFDGMTPVPASVQLSASGLQATLDPISALGALKPYTVQVTTMVRDLSGTPLAALFTSGFLTAPAASAGGTPILQVADLSALVPAPALALSGSSVAAAGDLDADGVADFISGSPGYQVGGAAEAGAALIYLGSADASQRQAPDIIFTGESAHDRVGVAVAGTFDFNQDGRPDIIVGAEQVDRTGGMPTATGAGKVYVIFFDPTDGAHYPNLHDPAVADTVSLSLVGQPGGIPGVVFEGSSVGDQAGFSIAHPPSPCTPPSPCAPPGPCVVPPGPCALLVGAPGSDAGGGSLPDAGRAYLIAADPALAGSISLSRVADDQVDQVDGIVFEGGAAGDNLGYSVALLDDVVGAPGGDIAMGAPLADTTQVDAGKVYVAEGGTLAIGTVPVEELGVSLPGTRIEAASPSAFLGYSIAAGGDSRADGVSDLLIGAPRYPRTTTAALTTSYPGAVFQSSGRLPEGIVGAIDFGVGLEGEVYLGAANGDLLGYAVAGVGDVDGDGYDDIALGAPHADPNGLTDAGTTYLVLGGSQPAFGGTIDAASIGATAAGMALTGTQAGESAGASLAGVGDVNGGGTDDFLVGAPRRNVGMDASAGAVYQVMLDDSDGDGTRNGGDCAPADGSIWAVPGEVPSFTLSDGITLTWQEPLERGGLSGTIRYDTIRSTSPTVFSAMTAICLETDGADTTAVDASAPPVGGVFFYLVRAENSCGSGSLGTWSDGTPRTARSCP